MNTKNQIITTLQNCQNIHENTKKSNHNYSSKGMGTISTDALTHLKVVRSPLKYYQRNNTLDTVKIEINKQIYKYVCYYFLTLDSLCMLSLRGSKYLIRILLIIVWTIFSTSFSSVFFRTKYSKCRQMSYKCKHDFEITYSCLHPRKCCPQRSAGRQLANFGIPPVW
jgi:hypothetical protein